MILGGMGKPIYTHHFVFNFTNASEKPFEQIVDVVYMGIEYFQIFEQRSPENLQELCASPYIPVLCKDLIVPERNVSILDIPAGEAGYISLQPVKDEPGMTTKLIYIPLESSEKGIPSPAQKFTVRRGKDFLIREQIKDWTEGMKTTLAITRYLNMKVAIHLHQERSKIRRDDFFRSVYMGMPVSEGKSRFIREKPPGAEVYENFSLKTVFEKFQILHKLRNPYTGKHAQPGVISCKYTYPRLEEIPENIPSGTPLFCDWTEHHYRPGIYAFPYAERKIFYAPCRGWSYLYSIPNESWENEPESEEQSEEETVCTYF